MELKMYRVDAIKINPSDKKVSDDHIASLKASILEEGLLNPVLVKLVDGFAVLVSGHQRMKVLMDLGWRMVPCYILENELESVPYVQTTLGEQGRQVERLLKAHSWAVLSEKLKMPEARLKELYKHRNEA